MSRLLERLTFRTDMLVRRIRDILPVSPRMCRQLRYGIVPADVGIALLTQNTGGITLGLTSRGNLGCVFGVGVSTGNCDRAICHRCRDIVEIVIIAFTEFHGDRIFLLRGIHTNLIGERDQHACGGGLLVGTPYEIDTLVKILHDRSVFNADQSQCIILHNSQTEIGKSGILVNRDLHGHSIPRRCSHAVCRDHQLPRRSGGCGI